MADILSPEEMDALLNQMKPGEEDDDASADGMEGAPDVDASLEEAPSSVPREAPQRSGEFDEENLQMILNIPLDVRVEIGRAKLCIGEILELCQGSVIELNHLASELIDLTVNDKIIAQGEAVVVNENFGLRVLEVDSVGERIRKL